MGTLSNSREGETCRRNGKWYDKDLQCHDRCRRRKLTCKEGRTSTEVSPNASEFSLSCNSAGNDVGKSLFPPKLNWNGASVLEVNMTATYRCNMAEGLFPAPALCGFSCCGDVESHKGSTKIAERALRQSSAQTPWQTPILTYISAHTLGN